MKFGVADSKKSWIRFFARYVVEVAEMMTLADVARHFQISWDVAEGFVGDPRHWFTKPKLQTLKRIAISEIYLGKRHIHLVMDLDGGSIVFGDGKAEQSLEPLWRRLSHSRAKIVAVAADLSPAYSAAIRQNLAQAQ